VRPKLAEQRWVATALLYFAAVRIGIIHRGLSLAVDLSSDRSEGQDAGQLEKCGYVRLVEEGDLSLGMDQPLKFEAVDECNRERRHAGYWALIRGLIPPFALADATAVVTASWL
jgi:hypothetical protein